MINEYFLIINGKIFHNKNVHTNTTQYKIMTCRVGTIEWE